MIRNADDPLLPGVQIALDLDAVLPLLNRALREHGEEMLATGGTIVDVQYKPGRTCLVMYRLRLVNHRTGRRTRRLFSAQVQGPTEASASLPPEVIERFAASRKRSIAAPELLLPGTNVVMRPFPLDAAMPWLVDAADTKAVKRHLNDAWRARKMRVRGVTHRVLGYTPHARATFVYDVRAEHRETGAGEMRRVIGKTHVYKSPDRLFADAWALWRAADGRVGLAEPLGYVAPLRMTLQEQVPGQRLSEFAGSAAFTPLVRQTARAIATIHGLSCPLTTRRNVEHEMRVVHRWADVLLAISPQLESKVERLRDRLVALFEERIVQPGPVHGDFHPANILSDGHDITLIDLDEVAHGDPLVDVGRFLASLRVSAMRVCGDLIGLADAEEAFLDEYLRHAPGTEQRARLFEATSLLIAAAAPFRLQREGWEEGAAQLVEEAGRILGLAEGAVSSHPNGDSQALEMSLDARLRWASDGMYVQALLHPHLMEAYGVTATACTTGSPVATESGYSVRYRLTGRRGDEKWRARFLGCISRQQRGSGLKRRLAALRAALEGELDAPLLPRPVAHLGGLSMLVVEEISGVGLTELLGTPDAIRAGVKLGQALAVLQRADTTIQKTHALEDDIRMLHRHVTMLGQVRPDLHTRANAVLENVAKCWEVADAGHAPTLRGLPLQYVRWLGDQIAVRQVRDVALSHPLIDIGDVLARLTLIGIHRHRAADVGELAEGFLSAYAAASGTCLDALPAFQAGALLRLACREAEQAPMSATAEQLLRHAETRLVRTEHLQ